MNKQNTTITHCLNVDNKWCCIIYYRTIASKSIVLHSYFLDHNTVGRFLMLVIMRRDS